MAAARDAEVSETLRQVYNKLVRIMNPSRNNHVSVANDAQNSAAIPSWRNSIVVEYLDDLEVKMCRRINALSHVGAVRRFFSAVSKLGDYPAWVIFGVIVAAQQGARAAVFSAQALAVAGAGILVYKVLKKRLVRERPYITHGDIVCGTAPLDRYSFPSGHTLHAISLTVLYGAYEPMMLIVMAPFAALVAASRIILGLHYPSDVLVGGTIGAALATLSLIVVG